MIDLSTTTTKRNGVIKMAKTIINKYGYEVVSPSRCKTGISGQSVKKGDTVELLHNTNGTVKAKQGDRLTIKSMWKNKYATVLEFIESELSVASTFVKKV